MEFPIIQKNWKRGVYKVGIVYPNLYYGGVYCLGPLILYNIINKLDNFICDRVFLDKGDVSKYDLVGFSLQYAPDYYNFLKMRKKCKRIVFAGGPCVNMNHKTLSKYVDFFVLGEAEVVIKEVLNKYKGNKEEFLGSIKDIKGVFVPGKTKKESFAVVKDINEIDYPLYQPFPEKVDKSFVFDKVFMLEIERGCNFGCKFCPMPQLQGKTKYRSLENIKKIIDDGLKLNKRDKVMIYSASFSHPQRKEILKYLIEKNVRFSVPSLRVELVDEELLRLIKKGGQKTLTIAPEADEKARIKLGKNVKDEKYFEFIELANKIKFETLKVYFMVGVDENLDEMIKLIEKIKEKFGKRVYISVNPFIPKPRTEFEDKGFDKKEMKRRIKYLKKNLSKIKVKFSGVSQADLDWRLGLVDQI